MRTRDGCGRAAEATFDASCFSAAHRNDVVDGKERLAAREVTLLEVPSGEPTQLCAGVGRIGPVHETNETHFRVSAL